MGKGKGVVEYWVSVVKFGCVMFEVVGVIEEQVKEVFCLVGYKFFIQIKMVKCEVYDEVQ